MDHKFVVFNCNYNGLSIIQDLGRKGVKGYALDSHRSVGTRSKYVEFIRVTDPKDDEKKFINELRKLCEKETQKPVLFPTNDAWAAAIAKNKEELKTIAIPVVSDWNSILKVLDKSLFYSIGAEHNYQTPKSWNCNLIENIEHNNYPLVIKPKWRRMTSEWGRIYNDGELDKSRLITIKNKQEGINELLKLGNLKNHFLLQTKVNGISNSMVTIGVYANEKNEILGTFTGKKVRGFPAKFGDTVVGESAEVPDELKKLVLRCTKEIKLEGILEYEFMFDHVRNRYFLIEINPRSWSWIGATSYVGVDLPWLAYKDKTRQKINLNEHLQKTSNRKLRYIFVHKDFINALFRYKYDYPEWSMNLFQWLKSVKNSKYKRIVFGDFSLVDFGPSFYSLKLLLKGFFREWTQK